MTWVRSSRAWARPQRRPAWVILAQHPSRTRQRIDAMRLVWAACLRSSGHGMTPA